MSTVKTPPDRYVQPRRDRDEIDREDRDEAKRLAKMKRQIERRTTKDLTAKSFWARPLPAMPEPVEQSDALDEQQDDAAPPREGLIPGTFRMIAPERLGTVLDDEPLPPRWTARHVGARLIEAHEVLRRLPMKVAPATYGAMWPAYQHEAGELAHQAGAGTLAIGRNVIVRTATADEIARMNEALQWPVQFLSTANVWALRFLSLWAADGDPEAKDTPAELLQFIADMLNAEKEPVR